MSVQPRIKSAYYKPEAGEWIRPISKGYRLACCDCGLVHLVDFRIRAGKAEFAVHRGPRETAAIRRKDHTFIHHKQVDDLAKALLKAKGTKTVRAGEYLYRLKT